jgi:putative cell wall-binding protein
MKRKICSITLTLMMLATLLPVFPSVALAEPLEEPEAAAVEPSQEAEPQAATTEPLVEPLQAEPQEATEVELLTEPSQIEPLADPLADPAEVSVGTTITQNGSYHIQRTTGGSSEDNTYGTITIAAGRTVTLVGNGVGSTDFPVVPYIGLKIVVKEGAALTLQNVYMQAAMQHVVDNLIDFEGTGTLNIVGTNIVENKNDGSKAVVHVDQDANVTFTGEAAAQLYIHKSGSGAGIGANGRVRIDLTDPDSPYLNGRERSGTMNFRSGIWYVYGNNAGPAIGTNTNSSDNPGDINIEGATLYVHAHAMGAGIGSASGGGEDPPGLAGDVYLKDGSLYVWTDWMGSTIGRGGHRDWDSDDYRNEFYSGRLIITGGSFKPIVSNNATAYWQNTYFAGPTVVTTEGITAEMSGADGEPLSLYKLDIHNYANTTVNVEVDGRPFFTGSTFKRMFADNDYYSPACWPAQDPADPAAYLFLSRTNHLLEINDEVYSLHWNGLLNRFELQQGISNPIWDGAVDVSWYNATGTDFVLTTPAQLAGLAAIVNGVVAPGSVVVGDRSSIVDVGVNPGQPGGYHRGADDFAGKTVHLGSDLDMGGVITSGVWSGPSYVPVGGRFLINALDPSSVVDAGFNGSFDGEGYVIKNVNCVQDSGDEVGIIGRLGSGDEDAIGPLSLSPFSSASPVVRKLVVGNGIIRANGIVGGIVGRIGEFSSGSQGAVVEHCTSSVTIVGEAYRGAGGIVGVASELGVVRECYFMGTLSVDNTQASLGTDYAAAGIVGSCAGTILNSYSVGTISVDSGNARLAAIATAADTGAAVARDCFWLSGSALVGFDGVLSATNCAEKSNAEMLAPSFVSQLNSGSGSGSSVFVSDNLNINNGYPVLRYQNLDLISDATFSPLADVRYTGNAITPVPTATFDGAALRNGTDFTLAYQRNVALGTASVHVFGVGIFRGYQVLRFNIIPADTTALSGAVQSAQTVMRGLIKSADGSEVYNDEKWVALSLWGDMEALVAASQAIAADSVVPVLYTQGEIDAKAAELLSAIESFVAAGQPGLLPRYPVDTTWTRLYGPTRYQTMDKIVRKGWTDANAAIIATGENFPDALAASALAGVLDAPVILTSSQTLSPEAASLLKDLGVKKVYVVGSSVVVSDNIFNQIKAIVPDTTRSFGADRFATAEQIYYAGQGSWSKTAIISTSHNYADALSISPFAFAEKAPIFLADAIGGLTPNTVAAIKSGGFDKILIVGDSKVVPDKVKVQLGYAANDQSKFTRLGGADRYRTSALITEYITANSSRLGFQGLSVATGNNFPDALAGGAFNGRSGSVLLLAAENSMGTYGIDAIVKAHHLEIGTGYFLGSETVVPQSLATKFQTAARGQ